MRNGLVQLGAWAAATGAAVALSWFGVHAVLTGAAFEQPTALPLPSPAAGGARSPVASAPVPTPPQEPSTPRPESSGPTPAPASSTTQRSAAAPGTPPASRRPAPTTATTTAAAAPTATSTVRSYPVPGGKVALDIRPDNASLVSATPDPGWQMQVWNGPQWMRVDFTKGDQANSVFVAWNGHPPTVETVVR
ncbi:hypothetical protein OG618_14680 [Kitasatospora sp. NBC_01246]|uniref:hypothetical protein n=1 Tax=Kitasatospora sp. NBC_01246 TaxID=2903570 RepID=UPI002E3254C1|nr:hypothetical protein [Kitasatospora sp. NBC_01246]